MKKSKTCALLAGVMLAGGLMASTATIAEMKLDRASMLANTCTGCHGPMGISGGPAAPSIAGMSEAYFIESMEAYRDGMRPSTIMERIAKGYTDEEIRLMAAFYAKQKFVSAEQSADSDMAIKGEKLHDKYCEKCHSEGGALADDDAGILAGQWKPYLQYNLYDFTEGNREAPKKMAKALKKVHEKAGEDGVAQLIEYYSSK